MKSKKQFLKIFLITITLFFSYSSLSAQELSMGADIVSKYVWRGAEINKAPNIQPAITYSNGGFETGLWGSYAFVNNAADVANYEIDAFLSYSFGDFGIVVSDYYFPDAGKKLGNFDGEGAGAHTIEIGASYSGPISISAYYNIHNDIGNNMYFEIGYSTTVSDIGLDLFVGATPGSEDNPSYYGPENFSVINIGLTASKSIKVTEDFKLPVFTSFIINPQAEIAYMIFGISL